MSEKIPISDFYVLLQSLLIDITTQSMSSSLNENVNIKCIFKSYFMDKNEGVVSVGQMELKNYDMIIGHLLKKVKMISEILYEYFYTYTIKLCNTYAFKFEMNESVLKAVFNVDKNLYELLVKLNVINTAIKKYKNLKSKIIIYTPII